MGLRLLVGSFVGVSSMFVASLSHAQCSKDTDCKGDRVCENGSCVTPSAPLPPPPVAPPAQPEAGAALPQTEPSPAPVSPQYVAPPPPEPEKPQMQRHSKGMMVGGIVMTSIAPLGLFASMIANLEQTGCEGGFLGDDSRELDCSRYDKTIYGGLIVAGVLLAAGIPMIVIGGKKEPVGTATLSPWVTTDGGGLGLRVDL